MTNKMEEEQDVENIAVDNKVGVSAENNDDLLLKLGKDYAQYMSIDIKKQVSPLNPDFFLIGQIKSHTDFFSQNYAFYIGICSRISIALCIQEIML